MQKTQLATEVGFHSYLDTVYGVGLTYTTDTGFTYTFENFFHPYVGELIDRLNKTSVEGMLDPVFHEGLEQPFFNTFYTAITTNNLVAIESFPKAIEVMSGAPYANYNWELLFHIPLTIAVHLSKNQRFAEAQRWFHLIFDPTCNDTSIPTPLRFWRFLAFRHPGVNLRIEQMLALLSKPTSECSPTELQIRESVLNGLEAIRNDPFKPHKVARTRQLAYQYCVVMKYLDNLIAWGDSLFRQDTIESINEATQRYVLAANLLGARPQRVPPRGGTRPKTFAELRAAGLDAMGNALVELEGQFPFNVSLPVVDEDDPDAAESLFGIGRTLYFCIPQNDKMLGYWDTVADRLFKIRNCMNIEGVVRQLALFDPPIDPGMLVKAAAAGINIGSLLSGLNQPVGPVRSQVLIQKALELCAEVRGLGQTLLSTIEKRDGERMALLRQEHEVRILQLTQEVRFLQWKQTQEATDALQRSRKAALERYRYYQRVLGWQPEGDAPADTLAIDRRELTEENFDEAFSALVGQYEQTIADPDYAPLATKKEGRLSLQAGEYEALNGHADRALAARITAQGTDVLFGVLALIPTFHLKASYWGIGPDARLGGGDPLASAGRAVSSGFEIWARAEDHQGERATKTAGYERRADDWTLQCRLAAVELGQIGRQLIGSLIAEQIARREYLNTKTQIEQAQDVDRLLREKFTNEELYAWMQGEMSRLYYEYYRFAFDTARKAEQAMKQELMRPELDGTDFVKFNYWDAGRKGLLSGEALYLDVKRMELAYLENNKREYELTRHVSLRQLAPEALLALKATGLSGEFTVPEWLFALDAPGLYMRRIKNVSVSIPSVTGPYTSVNCTLSLLRSTVRTSPALVGDDYARQGSEDTRFRDYFGAVQSVVTSSASDDSGLFETNLRDERFLPFEGAGVESTWTLELPRQFRQFDYNTIADVVLHIRYTARQGGSHFGDRAVVHLQELIGEATTSGLALMFSLPHEFPTEWHRFVTGTGNFTATVKRDYFPYFTTRRDVTIEEIRLFAIVNRELKAVTPGGLNLSTLTTALKNDEEMDLSFAPDATVLVRDAGAQVFLGIRYSLG
ncbi:MAG TPA: hypothetical protein VGQ10_20110 [Vicinamibacterales bacterium]|jgi:hypothetical protein|nr:hypothetical protein [Vicinamibacterales bacterium]